MSIAQETLWLLDEKYKGRKLPAFFTDIERVRNGEPVDYVIGFSRFLGCRIDLSFRPLIPRQETEYWTEIVINSIKESRGKRRVRVLDMFAGSGCVGIAVLKHIPRARVDFADIEEKFLKQIKKNARLNGIPASRYVCVRSNIFSNVRWKYDYILANPPYVASGQHVASSVKKYEPQSAFRAGKDGLRFIKPFLRDALNHLAPDGSLYMEFGLGQKRAVEKMARAYGYAHCDARKDQFGRWRFIIGKRRILQTSRKKRTT